MRIGSAKAAGLATIAVGLQIGGALGNVLDRVVFGGATDVFYLGVGPVWNVADMAIGTGMLMATSALALRHAGTTPTTVATIG